MESESQIQAKIIKQLKNDGYIVIKTTVTNYNGCPDIIALKNGKALFFEVKTEKGKLSLLQELRIYELERQLFECYVVRTLDEVINVINTQKNEISRKQ